MQLSLSLPVHCLPHQAGPVSAPMPGPRGSWNWEALSQEQVSRYRIHWARFYSHCFVCPWGVDWGRDFQASPHGRVRGPRALHLPFPSVPCCPWEGGLGNCALTPGPAISEDTPSPSGLGVGWGGGWPLSAPEKREQLIKLHEEKGGFVASRQELIGATHNPV